MSIFSGYSREQLRRTYTEAWSKHRAGAPLTPLEALIADVVAIHPEYHALIADPETALAIADDVAAGRENPFLHMGLHIAIREQLSIDRPPGVREVHRLALARAADGHDAEHALMQALGETLWEAQRQGTAPDESRYLDLARRATMRRGA